MSDKQSVEIKMWYDIDTTNKFAARAVARSETKRDVPEEYEHTVDVLRAEHQDGMVAVEVVFYIEISKDARNIAITQVGGGN